MGNRSEMIPRIKEIIVPQLREWGFKGSYPHFRRANDEGFDLLSFQFNRHGGSFLIELSVAYPMRTEYRNCYFVGNEPLEKEIKKINVSNTFARYRVRNRKDEWFRYEMRNKKKVAEKALKKLSSAIKWFENPLIYDELNDRKEHELLY